MSDDNKNVWLCSMKWIVLKSAAYYSMHTLFGLQVKLILLHVVFRFFFRENR